MNDVGNSDHGVIPYVDHHSGPRRVLTLDLRSGNRLFGGGKVPPIASIDGRTYIVPWDTAAFEIPADRPCHVSVHMEGNVVTQAASTLLPPGRDDLDLTYTTQLSNGIAKLE